MSEQETTPEQPAYSLELHSAYLNVIKHKSGRFLVTPNEYLAEVNGLANEVEAERRRSEAALRERDEARAEVDRLHLMLDLRNSEHGYGSIRVQCDFYKKERDEARSEVEKLKEQILEDQNRCNPYVSLTTQKDLDQARAEVERLRCSFSEYDNRIQQELGKELGYPWFKDSQEHFPGATESNGVCVGDHVGETLAIEAAEKIRELRAEVEKVQERLGRVADESIHAMRKRDEACAEVVKLKAELRTAEAEWKYWKRIAERRNEKISAMEARPEPSRLEIAAMLLSGAMADPSVEGSCINYTWFLRQADALIAASKEEVVK
jgi:chromosome segregation ATPase